MPTMETVYTISTQIRIKFASGFDPNTLNGGYSIDKISLYSDNSAGDGTFTLI